MKSIFLFILLFSIYVSNAQSLINEASLKSTGLAGNGNALPYWMIHNQLGKFSSLENGQELTEGNLSGGIKLSGNLYLSYGANLALLISKKGIDPEIIQAYLGLSGKVIRLQAGAFADEEVMGAFPPPMEIY
jgi:hypothetical protein